MDTASLVEKVRPEKFSKRKILLGLGLLELLLLSSLLVIDGLLFYKTFLADRTSTEVPLKKSLLLSNSEIDEIVKLLDERDQKLNAILTP